MTSVARTRPRTEEAAPNYEHADAVLGDRDADLVDVLDALAVLHG